VKGGRRPDFGEDATRRVGADVADAAVVSFAKVPSGIFFGFLRPRGPCRSHLRVRPLLSEAEEPLSIDPHGADPSLFPLSHAPRGRTKRPPFLTILSVEDDDEAVERSRARGPRPPRRPMVGISGTEGEG